MGVPIPSLCLIPIFNLRRGFERGYQAHDRLLGMHTTIGRIRSSVPISRAQTIALLRKETQRDPLTHLIMTLRGGSG